jgi:prepilin-type N-terminal cleavage/methylation domain-containing protein
MDRNRQRGFSLIELLIVVAIIGIVAAIAIPNLLKSQQAARETTALRDLQAVRDAEMIYYNTKGNRNSYADLAALGSESYLDSTLSSGKKGGYVFEATPVQVDGAQPMFDASAKPGSTGTFGVGNKSYYTNETLVVYQIEGGNPPQASPDDRRPKEGKPIE